MWESPPSWESSWRDERVEGCDGEAGSVLRRCGRRRDRVERDRLTNGAAVVVETGRRMVSRRAERDRLTNGAAVVVETD